MNKRAATAVISAGILWGTMSVFLKGLANYGLETLQISSIRLLISTVIMGILILIKDRNLLKIKLKDIWMFICTGVVSTMMFNIMYFYTIMNSEASIAVVLLYTSPIFIILISAVAFKEKITNQKIIAVICTFIGCLMVSGALGNGYQLTPFLLLTGLGAGLFYGLYSIFGTIALRKYDAMTLCFYTFLMGGLASIPLGNIGYIYNVACEEPISIIWMIGLSIVTTIMPYFLYSWGLAYMEAGQAGIMVTSEPVVASLIGMLVYHETHGLVKIAGLIFVIGAIIFLNLDLSYKGDDKTDSESK